MAETVPAKPRNGSRTPRLRAFSNKGRFVPRHQQPDHDSLLDRPIVALFGFAMAAQNSELPLNLVWVAENIAGVR